MEDAILCPAVLHQTKHFQSIHQILSNVGRFFYKNPIFFNSFSCNVANVPVTL